MPVLATRAAGIPGALRDYRRTAHVEEEFISGTTTSQTIGALGWLAVNGTTAGQAGEADHPGILRRSTGGTSGTVCSLMFAPNSSSVAFLGTSNFDVTWVFRLNDVEATALVLGVGLGTQADLIVLDKASADDNFHFRTRTGGNQEKTDTGVAANTDWNTVRIIKTGDSVACLLNHVRVATNTTHLTSNVIVPLMLITNGEDVSKSIDLDYFSMDIEVNR